MAKKREDAYSIRGQTSRVGAMYFGQAENLEHANVEC
jgi:hypothetical protein